ncbi:hypothetical protein D3C76_1305570 [compost metagenome]
MFGSNAQNGFVFQRFTISQRHIRGDMDAVLLRPFHYLTVLQIRRKFDLVGRDIFCAHSRNRLFHQRDSEVRNTNFTRQSLGFGFQQCLHKLFN